MRLGFFLALLSLMAGCASARMSDHASDDLFRDGKYEEAAKSFKHGLEKQGENGRDQLLYLLDLGLTLHTAGKFEESNQAFLKADKVAEIKDYTSLSTESATLLTSENIKHYKGEDFENVLISTYLAMNYALMGNYEEALVEARRVNSKLYRMINEGGRKYEENAFARYLSGLIYEAEHNYNDAHIDYKRAWELKPDFPLIGRDLWRTAKLSGLRDAREQWEEEFGLSEEDKKSAMQAGHRSGKGEIIVLYENGISPRKYPNPQWSSLPKFYARPNPVLEADVELNGAIQGQTYPLFDIERTAIQNLDEKYGGLLAKKLAGVVVKEVVADQIERRTNSPLMGFIAKVAFYASDQADLRSWNLLPRDLQIARYPVDPGTYRVRVLPRGGEAAPEKMIQVEAGKKVFVAFRFVPR